MENQNFLQYTNLSYQEILEQVKSKLDSDPRFENFRESSIAATLIEIFAAMTEFNNYQIERRAEESYFDTAKLKSSIIVLARQLGYVVNRPNPAESALQIEITGPLPNGLVAGNELVFNRKTKFNFSGVDFILKNTYKYTFTASDISSGVGNANFKKIISYGLMTNSTNFNLVTNTSAFDTSALQNIEIVQGNIEKKIFYGSDNQLVGQLFQRYKINDTSVSNIYGSEDYGYDSETGNVDHSMNLTRVAVSNYDVFDAESNGTLSDYNKFYTIDRRTLLNVNESTLNFISAVPVCRIRTSQDGAIELEFGDNKYAKIGPASNVENIYVEYLSTLGKSANKIGVVGERVTTDGQFFVNSLDLTSNLSFTLFKNILGGSDLESSDSIKLNAPSIYYSLDRCVTPKDYISFLKTLTSPIKVKNAIAWGEQDESIAGEPIKKLFNVVLYSVLGELYDVDSTIHVPKTMTSTTESASLSAAILDENFNPYVDSDSGYYNIIVKENVLDQLTEVELSPNSRIAKVNSKLKDRSQITVKNVYLQPIIQDFDISGKIYLKKFANLVNTQTKINNSIYKYLNENSDFNTPIYKSNIIELIESFPEVLYTDINITPSIQQAVGLNYNMVSELGGSSIVDSDIDSYFSGDPSSASLAKLYIGVYLWHYVKTIGLSTTYTDIKNLYQSQKVRELKNFKVYTFDEKTFYRTLIYSIDFGLRSGGSILTGFANSTNFRNVIMKIHNDFSWMIRYNMLDDNENIVKYSLRSEIPKLTVTSSYIYK